MADERGKSDIAKREEEVLAFWKEQQIFEKSLEKPAPKGEFTFYDGPPFATGLPHPGHFLASTSKDVIPRYKTMRGYRVRRRWGWDTHGLPIESLVETELGLKSKKDILELGIENFNEKARSMVLAYVHEWKRYIERLGRFVDFDNSYKTMDNSFIESVWWALSEIHKKGRLYEGRKVLMYCPHCETPLAKAEIAMDNTYKDITEEAVTVKFKIIDPESKGLPKGTHILAWTTTPWTLPGNVGLAVGPDIDYVIVRINNVPVVLAKERMETYGVTEFEKELKGRDLTGISYEPLYDVAKARAHVGKKWEVLSADFVTTTDGTGVVHTAVIYGEDDYQLGLKEGLPMVPLLNPNATYNVDAPEFLQGQYIKKAEPLIKDDLETRGLLFAKAPNTHSYPHCYRCGTPLIYNAVSSWFIDIQAVKDRMLAENEKINWSPEHLKHGRFKKNIESAPDWTISRNRFWASPLPIWKDKTGAVTVVGSLEELKMRTKKSGNRYYIMRHGQAENTASKTLSSALDTFGLTEEGKEDVKKGVEFLKTCAPTRIYASPVRRTKETAEMAAEGLGIDKADIVFDDRLREFSFGKLEGRPLEEFIAWRNDHAYDVQVEGGESYQDVKRRFGEFLYEIEKTHQNECVLIVTHGCGLETLTAVAEGLDKEKSRQHASTLSHKPGAVMELPFTPLPHNRNYELDFHLPYIDRVELIDEEGAALTRIPEVVDCWVESGSMPFAEYHYPFEHKGDFEKRSPGDFISEYIGQTRAWFYYMHAISVSIFDRAPFRNVVTTGTILAANGEKLSKSKKNYTDPYQLFDLYGADAFRYYLMGSVVMQAEDLTFRDEDVKEAQNRVVNMLRNVYAFYALYKDDLDPSLRGKESTHVLDRWILARLAEVIEGTTDAFDRYDLVRAARPLRDFVEDLSTWYVRRSRDRIKANDEADRQAALRTLEHVLKEFSKVIAPVMPFVADEIFRAIRTESEPISVHLAKWPVMKKQFFTALFGNRDAALLTDMKRVRALTSTALMERQRANVKVRQPLGKLTLGGSALSMELLALIKEELNVEEVVMDASKEEGSVALDTELTPELIRRGDQREFARAVADARKSMDLSPRDKVVITIEESARETLSDAQVPGTAYIEFAPLPEVPHTAELSTGSVGFTITNAS
ncbi:MAG TPA: class I tRNA ligase family protein [Candidatus Paceibacterota bacterium]|nr:class I tRNA ligase family protein [Candidatus Paceibacterota bacterium]